MNKVIGVWFVLIALLGGRFVPVAMAQDDELRMVRQIHLPIVKKFGYVEIMEVPVTLNGALMNSFAAAMCAPVFAGSAVAEDYKRDINLISLSKIGITFKNMHEEPPILRDPLYIMTIDLSKFTQPKETVLEAYDIVQSILMCIRLDFPPGYSGTIQVRFSGVKESTEFSKLEGPLWVTSRDKMIEGAKGR
jgi:hypothetical protein